ncbi:hypothetical protein ACFQV8_17015 [Pseudonocardia benzenivorans]
MAEASDAVMAVVHVTAPAHLDPHAIAAELTRAINGNAKRPMTAELSVARDVRTPPRRRDRYRHGFVALLSFGDQDRPTSSTGASARSRARRCAAGSDTRWPPRCAPS